MLRVVQRAVLATTLAVGISLAGSGVAEAAWVTVHEGPFSTAGECEGDRAARAWAYEGDPSVRVAGSCYASGSYWRYWWQYDNA